MSKPRIAIAGFQHETNTFAPILTPYETFRDGGAWPALCTGQDVIDTLSGLNLPMGGFIDEVTTLTLFRSCGPSPSRAAT
jgi:microcystin degradation protein MlrC